MKRKRTQLTATLLVALALNGCATAPSPLQHPDPKVAYPAEIGGIAGMVAALPVTIVLSPITGFMSRNQPGPSQATAVGMPSIAAGYVTGNAVGAVPWLLFGWWGNEKYMDTRPHGGDGIGGRER